MMKQMKTANMVRRNLKLEQLADTLYSSLFSCLYSGSVCAKIMEAPSCDMP